MKAAEARVRPTYASRVQLELAAAGVGGARGVVLASWEARPAAEEARLAAAQGALLAGEGEGQWLM